MATVTPQVGLTAEQFALRPDPGCPEELVKGRIVSMPPPGAIHGRICHMLNLLFEVYVQEHDVGRLFSNDSGIIARRDPDGVRGADLFFYSYERLPQGPLQASYPAVPPELVVEVRSPGDRWPKVLAKAAEYLDAGVSVVRVLDDETRTVQVYDAEHAVRVLNEGDDLTLSALLPDLRVQVGRFFE